MNYPWSNFTPDMSRRNHVKIRTLWKYHKILRRHVPTSCNLKTMPEKTCQEKFTLCCMFLFMYSLLQNAHKLRVKKKLSKRDFPEKVEIISKLKFL